MDNSDKEILSFCVGSKNIAENLYKKFGGLIGIAQAQESELKKISGMGIKSVKQLKSIFELAKRATFENTNKIVLDAPESIYNLMKYLSFEKTESFYCIPVNSRLEVVQICKLSQGTLNECIAHPRDILREAINHNAYNFICVHNHPSGDPSPSRADREMTKRIMQAGDLIQIPILDHVIIGHGCNPYFSFREAGLI